MASFSSTLSQMLNSITTTKIDELASQRESLEAQRTVILQQVQDQSDVRGRVRLLVEGLKSLDWTTAAHEPDASDTDDDLSSDASDEDDALADVSGISLKNITRFLDQSKHDPSISTNLLEEWESKLKQRIEAQSLKYQYATLFGQLITEWSSTQAEGDHLPTPADTDLQESFEPVGRTEMHEQREQFESYVFEPLQTDVSAIEKYLQSLFNSTKESKVALEVLREKFKKFGESLVSAPGQIDQEALEWCIRGLLKNDLLSDEKRLVLQDLSNNKVVLDEVADVLSMRLATLDRWSWGSDGVPVEVRRQLNGHYRVFMDEDILQALFIQFIGTQWAVRMKQRFEVFAKSPAWKDPSRPMPKHDKNRREHFLGTSHHGFKQNIDSSRRSTYLEDYFMSQLPDDMDEGGRGYDSDGDAADARKSPVQIKQDLLHLLCTESLIQTALQSDFTVVRSDFKWFGPSLPHSTIFTVLKFLGVSTRWIDFFRRFLEAPVKFVQDGPDAQTNVRKRGVPMGHTLSAVFGEAILFCMDFAVNQQTDGAYLYRLHDDSWFWGQEERCVRAWKAMTEFAELFGIVFNEEKTGALRLSHGKAAQEPLSEVLPTTGGIRWGFLQLDAATGRFLIDQEQVDRHIVEIKRQLSACKSIFAFVQAWNSYADHFLITNFGQVANCFGEAHVDMMIETLERIQRGLFADPRDKPGSGNVTQHLKTMLHDRFGLSNIPDGFFYLPVELGGLDLRNPFVGLFALHGKTYKDPAKRVQEALEQEAHAYETDKKGFSEGIFPPATTKVHHHRFEIEHPDVFMSFEEYTRYREQTSFVFNRAYEDLCEVPSEASVVLTPEVQSALRRLSLGSSVEESKCAVRKNWRSMKPYWKWIVQLYAPGMIQRFGGLNVVEKGLLPMGMVKMLRSGKVRWQG